MKSRRDQVRVLKKEIDEKLAVLHNMPLLEISNISTAFFYEITRHLLDKKEVFVSGFGTFHIVTRKGTRIVLLTRGTFRMGERGKNHRVVVKKKYYVVFRKAVQLRDAIRERFGKAQVLEDDTWKSSALTKPTVTKKK